MSIRLRGETDVKGNISIDEYLRHEMSFLPYKYCWATPYIGLVTRNKAGVKPQTGISLAKPPSHQAGVGGVSRRVHVSVRVCASLGGNVE